ncbi:MAG: hypothetical protein E6I91_02065 [Chloroflexi bacterium]|nr:MAG: hypothetical protein E6I91_02065 [Chloroflexota bacterium]
MTQDSDRKLSSSTKRSARAGRNRPVLVTSQDGEGNELTSVEESTPTLEESVADVEAQNPPVASPKRRMPAFFSTIGKRSQTEEEAQEVDPAQARIARATRSKTTTTKASSEDKVKQKPEVKKEAVSSRSTASSRPNSIFKTRYLIGMGLYLLAANFIGAIVTNLMRANHLDAILTEFNLFGSKIIVSTSTVVFLAMLVIILVVLARLDLIPRNFSAMMGGSSSQQNRQGSSGGSSSRNQGTTEGSRNIPPTIKQGVKGADDDLYQEYRSNQRRAKKK